MSSKSAFHWNTGEPSIFSRDPVFTAGAKTGISKSISSTQAVERRTKELGYSPGSMHGITRAEQLATPRRAYAKKSGVR